MIKNKIFLKILIIFFSLTLTSCITSKHSIYTDADNYIQVLYECTSGEVKNWIIIDIRTLISEDPQNTDTYAFEHIVGSVNYDYKRGNIDTFTTWVNSMYSKNTKIYLIDDGEDNYKNVMIWLQDAGYKDVHAFTGGYKHLKERDMFSEYLEVATGTSDCGCN